MRNRYLMQIKHESQNPGQSPTPYLNSPTQILRLVGPGHIGSGLELSVYRPNSPNIKGNYILKLSI